MNTEVFLAHLDQLGVKLWAEGGQLHCNAPREVLTPELRAKLAERKAEILAFLHQPAEPPSADGLSPRQQNHLDAMIERYTRRTQGSKRWWQSYHPLLADIVDTGYAVFHISRKEMLYPIVVNRSLGSKTWDVDGNEYIDLCMGFGVNLFGHSPAFIIAAIEEQLKQGIALGPHWDLSGKVSALICELTGMERVTFTVSGTEAVMAALRLARTVTGRSKIVLFAGSYHGWADTVLLKYQLANEGLRTVPAYPGVPESVARDGLVLGYGDAESLEVIEAHAHELAAVLVEPVQSRRPNLQPAQFLHELRKLTAEKGIVLIFDEMKTGFRAHPGGAQAWFGIAADLATYGKAIGGGLPIGVVAGKAKFMDAVDGGMWNYRDASYPPAQTTFLAGTHWKHPLSLAATLATLTELKRQGPVLQERLNQRTTELAQALNTHFIEKGVPIRVMHFSSLFRFTSSRNIALLYYHLLEKGIFIWEGHSCLATSHTDEEIAYVLQAIKDSVEEMQTGGFLPEKFSNNGGEL
ncbi:MAG: aminotransferase class III-fold pyridoxal phosphate-dependent enzyme [Chloroflexi bacterium]|nr:aminotransferase class III-fold pyridoxal phosphate-dependent enzyme [Chloroflexota bacterium]